MKFIALAVVAVVVSALALSGCGSSSSSSGGDGNPGSPTGADKARWTGDGSYSTSLSYNGCRVEYSAPNQAEYCVSLLDEAKDTCNLRSSRKSAYQSECGDDFEPRNLAAPSIWGYDSYLQKQCSVESSSRFPRMSDLCVFLADESKNQGCFWQRRREMFIGNRCAGNFSAQPAAPTPAPQPAPKPAPQPAPQPGQPTKPGQPQPPTGDAFTDLVNDFATIGIEVSMAPSAGYPEPGRPSDRELLKITGPILRKLKPEFAKRVSSVTKINLASYTHYMSKYQNMVLDLALTESEITRYLSFHDLRVNLTKSTGVTFDLGIEIYGSETDKFAYINQALAYFTRNSATLKEMSKTVDRVEIGDSHYLTFFDRGYEMDRDRYQAQFASDTSFFMKLAPLKNVGVVFESYINLEDKHPGMIAFIDWANQNLAAMAVVHGLMGGTKFEINTGFDSDAKFYPSLKQVSIGANSKFAPSAGLKQLLALAPTLRDLGLEFEMYSEDLDANFIKASQLLIDRKSALLSKRSLIKKITITSSTSDFSYGTLYVGPDSLAAFDKVLAKIK